KSGTRPRGYEGFAALRTGTDITKKSRSSLRLRVQLEILVDTERLKLALEVLPGRATLAGRDLRERRLDELRDSRFQLDHPRRRFGREHRPQEVGLRPGC